MRRLLRIVPVPVLLLSVALAMTQPLIGVWLAWAPPDGYVATRLHIPDSALFVQSMRMFSNGLESQYATCQAPATRGIQFYPLPHLWLYGASGAVARLLGVGDYAAYFAANGMGAFAYLIAVYLFLGEIARKHRNMAFVLFCLSGGLGGVLYLATLALGLHSAPMFEDYFRRFALYELFEGAHLQPVLYFPRLYYTLSLALCLGALTLMIKGCRGGKHRLLLAAGLLFVPGMFIDMRYGAFTLALAFLYLWQEGGASTLRERGYQLGHLAVPGVAAGGAAWLVMGANPAAIQNHIDVANTAMWLTPFVTVGALHLLVAPREIYRRMRGLPPLERALAFGGVGYLAAFAILFGAYQAYWGNVLVARDAAAALAVSDWALVGAGMGVGWALVGWRKNFGGLGEQPYRGDCHVGAGAPPRNDNLVGGGAPPRNDNLVGGGAPPRNDNLVGAGAARGNDNLVGVGAARGNDSSGDWLVLWLVSFLVMSITAFGGGWWLKFGPQRLQIFLWLPLCVMTAAGLSDMRNRRLARAITAALIGCGVCSLAVAVLFFQGPLAFSFADAGARPPYAGYHAEIMTANDAAVIGVIGGGTVLAPNLAADVVAINRANRVVFGTGSFNMSDQPYAALEAEVNRFFAPDTSGDWQRDFLRRWCVDWVYCPETWPVSAGTVEQIGGLSCVEHADARGGATLFRVKREGGPFDKTSGSAT